MNCIPLHVAKRRHNAVCRRRGSSILEILIAMLIMFIALLGTMNIRYYSTIDTQRAEVSATACRVVLLLQEAWRGSSGSDTYDPVTEFNADLTIQSSSGPQCPTGFGLLGSYQVELDGINYYISLSYKDINANLRALNTTAAWEQKGKPNAVFEDADESLSETVYIQL